MTDDIYLIRDDGTLVEMSSQPYDSEELLQRLLAEYPSLLAGEQIDRASYFMTDEAGYYKRTGREYGGHGTVNHSIKEYVRGGFWHTNTVEGYFSILKRGITGNYQWVSAKHLKRYLGEFDFRYNSRDVSDLERAALAAKGIQGKRLTYRRTHTGA